MCASQYNNSNHQVNRQSVKLSQKQQESTKSLDDSMTSKKSKPPPDDTIKVVVRFRGTDELGDNEVDRWRISS